MVFRRLFKLAFSLWRWILLATLFGLFTVLSSIFLMGLSAFVIARAALMPSIADLQVAIVGVRFFGIARGVFRYLERYISHEVTFRLLARLRVDFYTALEPLAPARLLHHRQGDLLARIVADIGTLEHFYVHVLAPPIIALLTSLCVGGLIALLFDPGLTLILLLFWGLAGIAVPLLVHYLSYTSGAESVERRAHLNIALLDGVQGVADILAYGREQTEMARVESLSLRLSHVQKRMGVITGLSTALNALLINLALVIVLGIAVPQVSAGKLTGVDLTVIVLMTIASFEAVNQLPLALQYLSRSLAAGRRLFAIIDVDLSPAAATSTPVSLTDYTVTFENVTFRYEPGDPPALNNISFTLPQGERLLITGPSGAGKSTLGNVLLRFWDNYEGSIRIGTCDIQHCPPEQIRRHIAVVTQRTHLFNTTIRENLLLANREASKERLIETARQAQIHDFIAALPEGYDTWVGEQGLRLSGGERQRLAIARALLKDAPILLLDEPTANLDSITEQELILALQTLMQGRTTFIITHRPLELWGAHHHITLANGQIIH